MCRTERPRLGDDGMLDERHSNAGPVTAGDVVSHAALCRIATLLDAPVAVDYWKSTPYFLNFCDGYKFGDVLRAHVADPERRRATRPLVEVAQHLERDVVHELQPIEPGNGRMRRLVDDTVGRGTWQLLWLPPSLPYFEPGGPYASSELTEATKRLVFSSRSAAPTAIAALLSHEATRNLAGGERSKLDAVTTRLDWRVEGERPGAMTTLALFSPAPALARRNAPFVFAADQIDQERTAGAESWYWTTILEEPGAAPDGLDLASGTLPPDRERRTTRPDDLDDVVSELGTFAPGNIAYRCMARLIAPGADVSEIALWRAAAVLASALRSLFNRPGAVLLLDQLLPGEVYWRAVLSYCAWGNLEAVLDEYLHNLAATDRTNGLDDEKLVAVAEEARTAITLRPSRYEAFDPLHPERRIPFSSRFAVRYGSKRASSERPSARRASCLQQPLLAIRPRDDQHRTGGH